jgi:hypothetical protein
MIAFPPPTGVLGDGPGRTALKKPEENMHETAGILGGAGGIAGPVMIGYG